MPLPDEMFDDQITLLLAEESVIRAGRGIKEMAAAAGLAFDPVVFVAAFLDGVVLGLNDQECDTFLRCDFPPEAVHRVVEALSA